jgi:hypothetical protein
MESQECVTPHSKVCKDCGENKTTESFYKRTNGNLFSSCKECCKARDKQNYLKNRDAKLAKCAAYVKTNIDKVKQYRQSYYSKNKDKMLAQAKEYRSNPVVAENERIRQKQYYAERSAAIQAKRKARLESNPDLKQKLIEYGKQHYENNKHLYVARLNQRRAVKVSATPTWADLDAIKHIYKQSRQISIETGILHHVDHIVPLQGETVSGLHVEYNLQIIPAKQNLSKANKLEG